MSKRVRLGADPELFFFKQGTQEVVPVCGLVGGTKDEARPLFKLLEGMKTGDRLIKEGDLPKGASVLEDGVAFEFNMDSYDQAGLFQHAVENILYWAQQWATKNKLSLAFNTPSAEFSEEVWKKHPEALVLGCTPDMDAYKEGDMMRPAFVANDFGNKRYSGGHLHLGYDTSFAPPHVMARFLDVVCGLPLIILGERQGDRRNFYGKAGLHRPKAYGVEYRTPSNQWLSHVSSSLANYVFGDMLNLGHQASALGQPQLIAAYNALPWADVKRAIDTENLALARDLHAFINGMYPWLGRNFGNLIRVEKPERWVNTWLVPKEVEVSKKPPKKKPKNPEEGDLRPFNLGDGAVNAPNFRMDYRHIDVIEQAEVRAIAARIRNGG